MSAEGAQAPRTVRNAGPLRVVALIAARNEQELIAATVSAVGALPAVERVLVVDDASGDGTDARARESGAEVLSLDERVGKGAAMNAGLATLAEDPFDVLITLDADVAQSAHQMAELIGAVSRGSADLAIARMQPRGRTAGVGAVKGLARWGISRHGGLDSVAPLSGQRALSRALVDALGGFAAGYAVEVDMTIRALDMGFSVAEIDTEMQFAPTGAGPGGFAHRGRQLLAVAGALWRNRG